MRKLNAPMKRVFAMLLAVALFFMQPTLFASAATTSSGSIARGIDVSKYNGVINWAQVKASGINFAFLKIGSTKSGLDPTFHYNITNAQANGVKVGVYLYSYATNVEQATMEALLVAQWLAPYGLQMPVVIDIEDKVQRGLSVAEVNAIINTFCLIIDSAGYYPMVYSYKNFFSGKIGATPWERWMAQYGSQLDYNGVSFWQYTSSGSVPGIGGRVDMNYQYKDYSKLIIQEGFIDHYGNTRFYRDWKMQKGWVEYEGHKYLLDIYGNMVRGFFPDVDGKLYYLDVKTGAAAVGLTTVENVNFYFGEDGAMQTGFIDYGQGMRYFDPALNGAMVTGNFFASGNKLYYALKDGTIATGIQTINGANYYFDEAGVMAVNQMLDLNGVPFMATETGILLEIPQDPIIPGDPNATDGDAEAAAAAAAAAAGTAAGAPATPQAPAPVPGT